MRPLLAALLLLMATIAHAHPVPKDNHDRTLVVRLSPMGVVVEYRLEVDLLRAAQDLPEEELAKLKSREAIPAAFLRHMAPLLADRLHATLDGKELEFRAASSAAKALDHVRCDYRFEADWQLTPGKRHAFAFKEANYPLDSFSSLHLTLDVSQSLQALDAESPDDRLLRIPFDKRGGGEDARLRKASATILAAPESFPGRVRPALPPDAGSRPALRPWAATAKPDGAPGAIAKAGDYDGPKDKPEARSFLDLLFDTSQGLTVLLLLAAAFGAAHALTPGHGKTMVAAYLIGERGTVWHAVVLGIVTTLTHTSSVIFLALMLPLLFPGVAAETVASALGLVGGLLIAAVGMWLLMQRLAGRADHVHFDAGPTEGAPGWWRVIVLGIAGGIVPCGDAYILLALAAAKGKLGLGLPLVLAFSAGLAGVLVAVGIAVVKARESLMKRRQSAEGDVSLGRWDRTLEALGKALPLVSAVLIVGIGLWLCFESGHGTHE